MHKEINESVKRRVDAPAGIGCLVNNCLLNSIPNTASSSLTAVKVMINWIGTPSGYRI